MATDPTYDIKISIYPFQEMRKKKITPMLEKEIGLKKPKNYEFKSKISVTSVKWNKAKIEDAVKTMFRYDLSILAAQMWEQYVPIEKAKNDQGKKNAIKAFINIVPDLLKRTEKKLNQSFDEFKEDLASGASDDAGEIKGTRKSLAAGHALEMVKVIAAFNDDFSKDFDALKKLKNAENKASGGEKTKATEKLEEEVKIMVATHAKNLGGLNGVLKKRSGIMAAIPVSMKKSMGKDVSDTMKDEYKTSIALLTNGIAPIQAGITKTGKNTIAALEKIKRKDVGSSALELATVASGNLITLLKDHEKLMTKIDTKLKKLEQIAKKR